MAQIVSGIGASHTTLMNTRWHEVDALPRAHAFRDALHQAASEMHAAQVDLCIIIGSNHFRGHWLDLMPSFAIGVDQVMSSGEHGTPSGAQASCPEHALAICNHLVEDGFDMAFSTQLGIDHGISHAIQYLVGENRLPIIPLIVNCFAPPLPNLARCIDLGKALRRAILALPDTLRVSVIASGGLSHHLPFPDWRAPASDDDAFLVDSWKSGRGQWEKFETRRRQIIMGARARLNEAFDNELLQSLCSGSTETWLQGRSAESLVAEAGNGANEIRNWLVMHAALDFAPGRVLAYSPMPEWLTGMGVFYCNSNMTGDPK